MSTPTVYGLAAFILAQPADRKIISHKSWNQCAVGDYAREVHGHEIAMPIDTGSMWDAKYAPVWKDPVLGALYRDKGGDQQAAERYGCALVENSLMDRLSDLEHKVQTYGEMRRELGDALHVDL